MKKNKKIFAFILSLFSFVHFNLFSQNKELQQVEQIQQIEQNGIIENNTAGSDYSNDERPLSKINFVGNTRTKAFYLNSRLKNFIGQKICDIDMQKFEGVLQEQGLFETIEIDVNDSAQENAEITVTVKEKITFLPLPFMSFSDSKFVGGLVVLDMNVLGIKDTSMLGGVYSPNALMAMASYIHTPKIEGFPGFSTFASITKNELKAVDSKGNDYLKYEGISIDASFSLIETFGDNFTSTIGISYSHQNNKEFDENAISIYDKVKSTNIFTPKATLSYQKTDWNGTFLSTKQASVNGQISFRENFKKSYNAGGGFSFQIPVTEKVRTLTALAASWGKDNHISKLSRKGEGLSTIFPGDFRTEEIYGAVAGIEWAAFKTKVGLFSIYSNFEGAIALDCDDEYVCVYGPSMGTKLYMSKIAFPALAMGLSYNIPQNAWFFAFALGVSM